MAWFSEQTRSGYSKLSHARKWACCQGSNRRLITTWWFKSLSFVLGLFRAIWPPIFETSRWYWATISYPSKDVESVLSRTLGVPIFQEQVIKLAMVAAGSTGGEADQPRRAMAAWKKMATSLSLKTSLSRACKSVAMRQNLPEQIFKQICGFGEYGFLKATRLHLQY